MNRILFVVILLTFTLPAAGQRILRASDAAGETTAFIVGDSPLVHTTQLLPVDESGRLIVGDETKQARAAMAALDRVLDGARAEKIVKINVVAASQLAADAARRVIPQQTGGEPPAMSFVVGALPMANARVAMDAIAIGKNPRAARPRAMVLPPGPRVYISGQAEKGDSPADAAARTLAKLMGTLEFVGASANDVVQARCFLTPIDSAAEVAAEVDRAFGGRIPLIFVEWKSDLPIEIEMIARCPTAPAGAPAVEYLTPPGVTGSPLFARVVRINRGDTIYLSGIYSEAAGDGEQQVTSIFEQLKSRLSNHGGDMQHLAKAIYYVSDGDASKKLNDLRPKYYDPKRPPAASKAMVPGVGMADRSIVVDMIGVVPSK
jgi:enamine deaminase RidA (YjgF/YER057c/UK114 family)